jgi:hypothetical protein
VLTVVLVVVACGGEVSGRYNGAKVGSPCTLAIEDDPTFDGFEAFEVSVELPSPDADPGAIVCLANHFRGRATCPYGGACSTPNGNPVTGDVEPWCADRRAPRVVTFSCRCANAAGTTNDGATYCNCPDDTQCEQLVAPIGKLDANISGAYCIPKGTVYDSATACLQSCDPVTTKCP